MEPNYLILFVTALIPLIIGGLWYSNLLFGKAWFKVSGMTEERMKSGNMLLIFGLTYFLGIVLSFGLTPYSVHQFSTQGLFATQTGFAEQTGEYYTFFESFMNKYGLLHRTFGHGAVHGGFAGVCIALPIIAINALFERRGWKYIMVHFGYWFITLLLMCGAICQFL